MAVRVVLELFILQAVIQKCATASHLPQNHCPDGYLARAIETPKGGVMQRCCLPIPTNQCPPEHEVVPCKEDKGADLCLPCEKGYVQPHFSDSFNGNACQGPGITCNEETEAVYQQGIWTCQCNATRGYCGDPTNCERPEPGCPKGLHLHHSSCECTPVPGPSKSSMMETTTPTKTVSSEMTTVPNQTLVTQKSPRNGPKAKLEKESRPHELLVDGHSLSESAVEDKDEPKPSSSQTGHDVVISVSVIVVVGIVVIVTLLAVKANARNYVFNLCSVFILNNFAGTASAPTNDSANDLVEGNPSQEESSETESLRRPIPEQGAAVAEEGSVGNAPDETLLKRPQYCLALHMPSDEQ